MSSGPGGFGSAPVTKGILVVAAAASIFFQAAATSPHSLRGRPLPFPLSLLPFRTPGELCFGTLLLYYFRIFERHMGSSKFGAYAASTALMAAFFQSLLRLARVAQPAPAGPYGLVFASFVRFFTDIPPFSTFTFFGFRMTDKVLVYLGGLQLLFSSGRRSLAAGLCGVAAGLLYHSNVLQLQRLRTPLVVTRVCQRLFSWMGDTADAGPQVFTARGSQWAPGAAGAAGAAGGGAPVAMAGWQPLHQAAQGGRGAGGAAAAATATAAAQQQRGQPPSAPPMPAPAPPPQEAVEQLVSMGFDSSRAVQALQQTGNDLQAAVALLL